MKYNPIIYYKIIVDVDEECIDGSINNIYFLWDVFYHRQNGIIDCVSYNPEEYIERTNREKKKILFNIINEIDKKIGNVYKIEKINLKRDIDFSVRIKYGHEERN